MVKFSGPTPAFNNVHFISCASCSAVFGDRFTKLLNLQVPLHLFRAIMPVAVPGDANPNYLGIDFA
jgi:hypothetical protein